VTPALGDIGKRLLLGRKLRSTQLGETLLPKRIALPVFASDALSSVAYAPDEIFLTLSIAGRTAGANSWKVAIVVAVVLLVVVLSYRQNVHAYPSGGGDYEVATVNLGRDAGITVASALLVDYVLTVAVSISSGAQYAASALPFLIGHEALLAAGLVVVLTALNLRGIKESGTFFAIPTYAFMAAILGMSALGMLRWIGGNLPQVESAKYDIHKAPGYEGTLTSIALIFLLARAFSSGCAALTGVEAISNGVPAFRKPKSKNAATTLLLLGMIAITMMLSVITLAREMGLRYVDPHDLDRLTINGKPVSADPDFDQHAVIAQIARAVFDDFPPGFYFVVSMTGIILVLAANTAFNGFPVLGSILAQDRFLPRQLHTRGDRLAFSNGIIFLATAAAVLVVAFRAETTKLIQLYIVGVFVSFTLSQTGMIRHWNRLLRTERDPVVRRRMKRSRAINAFGMVLTGFVLVLVLVTKFTHGAWISIVAMGVIYVLMVAIRRHYDRVARELEPTEEKPILPARNHAIVLVSKLHMPTLRALAYAKATRPDTLTALTVNVDTNDTRAIQDEWERRGIGARLTVIDSPYREITRPIIEYVKRQREDAPRDIVTVYIPEYVVGHWWENLLHNQSALRLKARLLFEPGVMVTSVPWQLSTAKSKNLERYDRQMGYTPARDSRNEESSSVR
jgi:amino acid transporter